LFSCNIFQKLGVAFSGGLFVVFVSAGPCQNRLIDLQVISDHAVGRKMPFNVAATGRAVNFVDLRNGRYRFSHGADQKTILAVFDKLGHAAPIEGNHGRTAGHGFDHGQAKRLIEVYGV
jgi:hypothetical protein